MFKRIEYYMDSELMKHLKCKYLHFKQPQKEFLDRETQLFGQYTRETTDYSKIIG